jgi:hypothetical protein
MISRRSALVVALAAVSLASAAAGQPPLADPFAFVAAWITVTRGDRARLAAGQIVARTLPSRDAQAAVFVVSRLNAPPDRLAEWTHAIAEFKRSRFVLAIGRFSEPPTIGDLAGLAVDDDDIDALQHCRPGACKVKLTAEEIAAVSRARSSGGAAPEVVQQAFRLVVLRRLQAYRAAGLAGLPPVADRDPPRHLDHALSAVLQQSPYLTRVPGLGEWLADYPRAGGTAVDSFFYWSKEHYGSGKPVISVTHVGIVRPPAGAGRPAIVVAGKQIFATHYVQASLGLTMVFSGGGDQAYLAYLNRSAVDVLGGMMGPLARSVLERRMARQAPLIISGLRTRLEAGAPPTGGAGAPGEFAAALRAATGHQRLERVEQRPLRRQDSGAGGLE